VDSKLNTLPMQCAHCMRTLPSLLIAHSPFTVLAQLFITEKE
jgi:hypothetical protein